MMGEAFSLADCAAAPALFYADIVEPFAAGQDRLKAYLARLMARPSFARVLAEAGPYFRFFPFEARPQGALSRPLMPTQPAGGKPASAWSRFP